MYILYNKVKYNLGGVVVLKEDRKQEAHQLIEEIDSEEKLEVIVSFLKKANEDPHISQQIAEVKSSKRDNIVVDIGGSEVKLVTIREEEEEFDKLTKEDINKITKAKQEFKKGEYVTFDEVFGDV